MVEEHDHPSNHWLREEGMNMAGIHMVELEGMDRVEERPSNHRLEVEGIDREDIDMVEDMTVEVEVVKREHEGVVLVRHWISDGVERHQQARWEWEELMKSRCSEGHTRLQVGTPIVQHGVEWRKLKKRVKMR
jgi:hypothetical protein